MAVQHARGRNSRMMMNEMRIRDSHWPLPELVLNGIVTRGARPCMQAQQRSENPRVLKEQSHERPQHSGRPYRGINEQTLVLREQCNEQSVHTSQITYSHSSNFCTQRRRLCTLIKTLKVLSSELDPVEIRLIRQIFIKGSVAAGFLEKSARPPSSQSPLKYESASYFSTANYAINLDRCGDIHCALGPPLAIENRIN